MGRVRKAEDYQKHFFSSHLSTSGTGTA